MFSRLRSLFVEEEQPLVERWAMKNANLVTPDGIIAAALVTSFAEHFEDWTGCRDIAGNAEKAYHQATNNCPTVTRKSCVALTNAKTDTTLLREVVNDYIYEGTNKYYYGTLFVNGFALNPSDAQIVLRAYVKIIKRIRTAEQAAATAKRNMERNEEAWSLAEKLLGMKRNEFGALVPVKTADG